MSIESANLLARLTFFFKWAYYEEIKSKNTSKSNVILVSTVPCQVHFLQLTNIMYLYTYGLINKEPAVRAISRKGTFE